MSELTPIELIIYAAQKAEHGDPGREEIVIERIKAFIERIA